MEPVEPAGRTPPPAAPGGGSGGSRPGSAAGGQFAEIPINGVRPDTPGGGSQGVTLDIAFITHHFQQGMCSLGEMKRAREPTRQKRGRDRGNANHSILTLSVLQC
jgi:hypothetical protein